MSRIYVFKTSVQTKKSLRRVSNFLDQLLPGVKWNFDLTDCDSILRIESKTNMASVVIEGLNGLGFDCQELQ